MKHTLFALAAIFLTATAHAKLGYTLEQCRNEYGTEVKSETAWCGGVAYSFIHNGYYLYVIIPESSDKVEDVTYFDNTTWKPLTKEQRDYVWSQNIDPNLEWERTADWDGKHAFKKPYPHWVIYEKGSGKGSDGVVENAGLANPAGWQIRTLTQYLAEYKLTLKMEKK
jgi:hypothetical protein